ncbi:MAG: ExbD/TolR family protein [Planctomyces sp.]|nr:biopolymer transporter ExbD [Planctomyces sp.]
MRPPALGRQRSAFRFNITPMIDVVFLLIIFFLVASYFIRSEHARPVSLPQTPGGQPDAADNRPHLTVTIEPDGRYSVGGQLLSQDALVQRIQALAMVPDSTDAKATGQVRIRADRTARFAEVRQLIEACADSQITSIRFAVVQPGE